MLDSLPSVGFYGKLCAALLLVWFVADFVLLLSSRWTMRRFPGPSPRPVLGNLLELRKAGGLHLAYSGWSKQHGKVFRILLGRQAVVVISDPEMARQVALKYFSNFHDRRTRSTLAATLSGKQLRVSECGLLAAEGARWASLRAAWQGQFASGKLESYAEVMAKAASTFVANLEGVGATGQVFDISKPLARMTLEVIGTTALGVHFNSQKAKAEDGDEEGGSDLMRACKLFFSAGGEQNRIALLIMLLPRVLFPLAKALVFPFLRSTKEKLDWSRVVTYSTSAHLTENARSRAMATGHTISAPVVDWKWWKEAEDHPYRNVVPSEGSFLYRMVMARNKETGQPFSDRDVAAQLTTMMLAGYETTSTSLSFCVSFLCQNPAAEQKLLAEIDAFGADRPITVEALDEHFKFTEAVVQETLRLLPPAPVVGRASKQPCQVGDYIIPGGVDVHVNSWGMHYNPEFFPDPDAFKPERFLAPPTWPPYAYLPFGAGPRMCPGWKFATEEARITLIKIYQRYTFRMSPEHHKGPLEVKTGLLLGPKDGVWVTAYPRGGK